MLDEGEHFRHNRSASVATLRTLFAFGPECRSRSLRNQCSPSAESAIKDTVVAPTYGRVIVDFTADQPGPTLFHCHIQHHMDYGFKALLRYA